MNGVKMFLVGIILMINSCETLNISKDEGYKCVREGTKVICSHTWRF